MRIKSIVRKIHCDICFKEFFTNQPLQRFDTNKCKKKYHNRTPHAKIYFKLYKQKHHQHYADLGKEWRKKNPNYGKEWRARHPNYMRMYCLNKNKVN